MRVMVAGGLGQAEIVIEQRMILILIDGDVRTCTVMTGVERG